MIVPHQIDVHQLLVQLYSSTNGLYTLKPLSNPTFWELSFNLIYRNDVVSPKK